MWLCYVFFFLCVTCCSPHSFQTVRRLTVVDNLFKVLSEFCPTFYDFYLNFMTRWRACSMLNSQSDSFYLYCTGKDEFNPVYDAIHY